MSHGSSNKVAPWTTGGSVGQGDGSYKLGRPRRQPGISGQTGSPSMSADSTLSSKHATGKILDVPDDVEDPPRFPFQDPSYMEQQRNKPLAMQNRKGVVLRLTRTQLREFVREEFEKDGLDIDDEQINEFLSAIPRIAGSLGRNVIGNFADDIIAPMIARNPVVQRTLQNLASKLPVGSKLGKFIRTPAGAIAVSKTALLAKEIFGDLPEAIELGNEAIMTFDAQMQESPITSGEAWTDWHEYNVAEPLRVAKFRIIDNLIDVVERLSAPGAGSVFRSALRMSVRGTAATVLFDQIDALRNALSIVGTLIPGDDTIEQAFTTIEELDTRLESIGSYKRPFGEIGGGESPGITSMGPMPTAPEAAMPFMEVKNILRSLMELDEIEEEWNYADVDETTDKKDEDDEDVDEASGAGGVAGFVAPLHYDPESGQRMRKMYSRHYKTVGPELKPKP